MDDIICKGQSIAYSTKASSRQSKRRQSEALILNYVVIRGWIKSAATYYNEAKYAYRVYINFRVLY